MNRNADQDIGLALNPNSLLSMSVKLPKSKGKLFVYYNYVYMLL